LDSPSSSVRLDKWLWAARFFKTRGLAQTAIENGRVLVKQERVKVAYAVKVGDEILLRQSDISRTLEVLMISDKRGAASVAQTLYFESLESVAKREEAVQIKRFSSEPARSIEEGRPTKRDRRRIESLSKDY
jgi:ribosome-associated heat shock protein Hsp15